MLIQRSQLIYTPRRMSFLSHWRPFVLTLITHRPVPLASQDLGQHLSLYLLLLMLLQSAGQELCRMSFHQGHLSFPQSYTRRCIFGENALGGICVLLRAWRQTLSLGKGVVASPAVSWPLGQCHEAVPPPVSQRDSPASSSVLRWLLSVWSLPHGDFLFLPLVCYTYSCHSTVRNSLSHYLFISSIIYFCHCRLMDIYFILFLLILTLLIITIFIFLLKLAPLLLLNFSTDISFCKIIS